MHALDNRAKNCKTTKLSAHVVFKPRLVYINQQILCKNLYNPTQAFRQSRQHNITSRLQDFEKKSTNFKLGKFKKDASHRPARRLYENVCS